MRKERGKERIHISDLNLVDELKTGSLFKHWDILSLISESRMWRQFKTTKFKCGKIHSSGMKADSNQWESRTIHQKDTTESVEQYFSALCQAKAPERNRCLSSDFHGTKLLEIPGTKCSWSWFSLGLRICVSVLFWKSVWKKTKPYECTSGYFIRVTVTNNKITDDCSQLGNETFQFRQACCCNS